MAESRIVCYLSSVLCLMTLSSCSTSLDIKHEVTIPKDVYDVKVEEPVVKEPAMPDYIPASEDVSPLRTRVVDVVARNTPLRDVLHVIAEATGLNLVMEKGVVSETPVTMTLRNITAEDALYTIFSSADYFYTVRNNMLVVKALDTKVYELGRPAVLQSYNVDIGGDILGSALASTSPGGNAGGGYPGGSTGGYAGGSAGTTSGTTSIKGSITQGSKSDPAAFNFWDATERSLAVILGVRTAQSAATAVPGQGQPRPEEAMVAGQSFTINRLTGTIIVTASKRNLERVDQYLDALKRIINRQVLIEAKIIEVQLSGGLQFGIDWNQAFKNVRGIGPISLGTKAFSSVVSAALPSFNVNVAGNNFNSLLQALQQQGDVRTLSNPRVSIMNGQTSLLSVGRSQTFISNVSSQTTTAAGSAPITTFTVGTSTVLSGIMLGIVPFINENGEISLTITPIISNLVNLQSANVGSASSGTQTQISLPTVDLRELSTTVKVRDGQMVIIGGLISKSESLQDNKVPALGDIPVAGTLFTSRNQSESKTELVVVLQPVIISK